MFRISRSILEMVLSTKQAILTEDVGSDARFTQSESIVSGSIHSVMVMPIMGVKQQEDCLGVIQVDSRSGGKKFNDEDLDLFVSVAYQIAIAIENAQHHSMMVEEKLLSLQTRDAAIFSLAKLAESRDLDTGAHLERVQHYCRALVQKMASLDKYRNVIDSTFIHLIFQTSPLHDIGKVGIPDAILLKPGRLNDQEFEIMRTHTTIGDETLRAASAKFPVVSFLEMAHDIAATHHERYDGTGYPHQLKGDEIPLAGRITALADVYDALTSKRVYKQAFTHEAAKQIILKDRGTHFDPDVVDAFVEQEEQFLTIRSKFSENDDNPPTIDSVQV
jgi:response regulator RpfG family c-di-GMP phosphodiesterase